MRISATAGPQFLAAEEGSSGGIDLLLPETSELIAGIIAFAIIFFVVWRWVLPTLKQTLAKRQEAEQERYAAAERAQQEAEELAANHRQQVAGAQVEAAKILEDARKDAEAVKAETISRAHEEAGEIISRAREEAQAESERAFDQARRQVADLSIDLAEKVVGASLDREAQMNLVDDYLAELEAER